MPPRKRRTPPIITAFDQGYRCTTCDLQDLDRHTDLDDKTWTCNACGNPVLIDLADDQGHTHTIERRQAQHLTDNDRVVLDHDLSQLSDVYASNAATGKGPGWYIALQGQRGDKVEPDRYYNRLPR